MLEKYLFYYVCSSISNSAQTVLLILMQLGKVDLY